MIEKEKAGSQLEAAEKPKTRAFRPSLSDPRINILSWIITFLVVAGMLAMPFWKPAAQPEREAPSSAGTGALLASASGSVPLPEFNPVPVMDSVVRQVNLRTIAPTRPRVTAQEYKVESGDSVFAIAKAFNIKPETVLWANYDTLKDDPQSISVGQTLFIPPEDGVYYKWKEGDTLDGVAAKYKARVDDIVDYPGNRLDLIEPKVEPGQYVMIPGGRGEFRAWVVPTLFRSRSGANESIPGACSVGDGGAYGSGGFIWPTQVHTVSGNDFWEGHLGLDIAAGMGSPVYAADSGVVLYAGWIMGGYGNLVLIDHGNGYQTVYGHLSSIQVRCGASVGQGQLIALSGSSGNSTGPHLHFEIRLNGAFINPWHVLQ